MITWVNSLVEAQTYPVLPGDTKLLMNRHLDVFYIKKVTPQGRCNFATYKFEKEAS